LNKSVSVGDFKQHLRALGQRVEFDNATKALIREIEGGLPPDDTPPGGEMPLKEEPSPSSVEPDKGGGKSNRDGDGEIRPTAVIEKAEDKEAFIKSLDLSAHATPIPESLDVEGFLKSLKEVKNKERFIEHLASRTDGQRRLEYLHLVEPTLKNPDIELIFKAPAKKEYVKTFRQEGKKDLVYLLVTKDDDALLITGIVDAKKGYVRGRIQHADIIHSFIPPSNQKR
ncbi:PBECR2 nuclease fold domain-containing protein, partial [Helicobacter felis]|uniref:PBECR2 nuclease fold domain-containing protein n=1 Tax=Helicobacter felis TaxID=214 RepID=UPI002D772134